jgi:intracellular sulfur oxidation DsrE/DsrF family protein
VNAPDGNGPEPSAALDLGRVKPYRHVLIHANGNDPDSLTTALRVARNASRELKPGTRFDVIVQGPLVQQLTTGSDLADDVNDTVTSTITVTACHNSMDRAGVTKSDLLDAVGMVPSAGAYLIARQWDGWAYLRY